MKHLLKDTVQIRFSLAADEWPIDEFIEKIGDIATETYKNGDIFVRSTREMQRFETVWTIKSEVMKIEYAGDEDMQFFESIIAPLRPHIELINHYKEKYQITPIFFAHYRFYWAQTPGMRLYPEIITFAHQIGAIIDVYLDKIIDDEENE